MRFSVWPDCSQPFADIAELVSHCEQTGWDGAYVDDHFMADPTSGPADRPILECWALLAALAARTSRIRLGPLVSANTTRHPAVVANAAATIDQISNGRFVLGLGAGWQQNEHDAYGIELDDARTRSDRLEEACAVITMLLREDVASFSGTHYSLRNARCDPKPVQQQLPLLVAGKGERRTMRTAARYANEWNGWCTPETFREKCTVLDRHCEAIDRDPATIRRSTQAFLAMSDDPGWIERQRVYAAGRPALTGTPAEVHDQVGTYADAGVDELIVRIKGGAAENRADCEQIITEIAPEFRSAG